MSIFATTLAATDQTITLAFPRLSATLLPGQFFLARCEAAPPDRLTWNPYLRRALFPTRIERDGSGWRVTFLLEDAHDEGYAWLASRIEGEQVDLLGPFGKGFALQTQTRSILLAGEASTAPLLYPLMETMLDRGGRVALLLRGEDGDASAILSDLPYAVEARSEGVATFGDALAEMVRWADQLALALPGHDYAQISRLIRQARMRPTATFAQALVRTPLPCGVGACLACVTPLANGRHTRACLHGPVFNLLELG